MTRAALSNRHEDHPAMPLDDIAQLLSRVLGVAERSLDRPSGEPRRRDEIEGLFEQVAQAQRDAPLEGGHRLVNDWTAMLMKMVRMIERLGPLGDRDELARATTVGLALLPYVRADLSTALDLKAGAMGAG